MVRGMVAPVSSKARPWSLAGFGQCVDADVGTAVTPAKRGNLTFEWNSVGRRAVSTLCA